MKPLTPSQLAYLQMQTRTDAEIAAIIERQRRWGRAWLIATLIFLAVGICAIWRMMGS
jgi:hypothetical protein